MTLGRLFTVMLVFVTISCQASDCIQFISMCDNTGFRSKPASLAHQSGQHQDTENAYSYILSYGLLDETQGPDGGNNRPSRSAAAAAPVNTKRHQHVTSPSRRTHPQTNTIDKHNPPPGIDPLLIGTVWSGLLYFPKNRLGDTSSTRYKSFLSSLHLTASRSKRSMHQTREISGKGTRPKDSTTTNFTPQTTNNTPEPTKSACECEVTPPSEFSLSVLAIPVFAIQKPDNQQPWTLTVHNDGCQNGSKVFDLAKFRGNESEKITGCLNASGIRVQTDPGTNAVEKYVLLLAIEGTRELNFRCGRRTQLKTKWSNLPSIKVDGALSSASGARGEESTDKERRRSASFPVSAMYLVIVSFVCLVLLMLAVGFFLLWLRSRLDRKASKRTGQQSGNTYEEISEVCNKMVNNSGNRAGSLGTYNASQQIVSGRFRKTSDADVMSRPSSGGKHVGALTVEYSTTKDAVDVKSRPKMSVPCSSVTVVYEDVVLSTADDVHHRPHSEHGARAITGFRSAPDLLSIDYKRIKSERRKSALIRLLTAQSCPHSIGNKSDFPAHIGDLEERIYFELERNYRLQPLDASVLAIYNGMSKTDLLSRQKLPRDEIENKGDDNIGISSCQRSIAASTNQRKGDDNKTLREKPGVCIIDLSNPPKQQFVSTGTNGVKPLLTDPDRVIIQSGPTPNSLLGNDDPVYNLHEDGYGSVAMIRNSLNQSSESFVFSPEFDRNPNGGISGHQEQRRYTDDGDHNIITKNPLDGAMKTSVDGSDIKDNDDSGIVNSGET